MFHFTCSKRSLPLLGGGTARTVAHHVQHARDRRREGHGGAGCGRRLCKHLQRRHAEARQLQHSEDGPRDRRRPRRRPRCVCSPAACAPQLTTARARGSVICAAAALSLPRAGAERPILCRVQVIRSTRTRPSTSRPRAISLCREHTRATDTRSLMPGAPRGATTTSGATVARATTAVDASPGGGRHGTRIAQRRRGHHDGAAGWTAGGVAAVFYVSFRPRGLSPQGLHAVKTCLQHHAEGVWPISAPSSARVRPTISNMGAAAVPRTLRTAAAAVVTLLASWVSAPRLFSTMHAALAGRRPRAKHDTHGVARNLLRV